MEECPDCKAVMSTEDMIQHNREYHPERVVVEDGADEVEMMEASLAATAAGVIEGIE